MTTFLGVLPLDVIGLSRAGGGVLRLLATQFLWIKLVPPRSPSVSTVDPRPRDEGVITSRMWAGIFLA